MELYHKAMKYVLSIFFTLITFVSYSQVQALDTTATPRFRGIRLSYHNTPLLTPNSGVTLYSSNNGLLKTRNPAGITHTIPYLDVNNVFTGTLSATNLSGTNTGDQTINLTGAVTGSGTGTINTVLSDVTVGGTYGHHGDNVTITYNNKGQITNVVEWQMDSTDIIIALGYMPVKPAALNSIDYNNLLNKPIIPSAQVNSDWSSVSGITQILNKPTDLSSFTNSPGYITGVPAQSFSSLTGKPTTLSGYGITDGYPLSGNPNGFLTSFTEVDPTVSASIKAITSTQIGQWNTAYGWGNHAIAGYYSPSNVPAFSVISAKPTTLSGYGITDAYPLVGNPSGFLTSVPSQSFASLTGKPTTLSGYGITDAYPLTGNPSNFLTGVPAQSFSSLTGKPTTLSGYGITDAYPLSGNPSGFLTSVPAQSFASLTGKPTTLSGYGITDATSNARNAVSLTTTGTSGAATYNSSTGVLNIPNYAVNSGTVTSVGASSSTGTISISGSPVTTSGSINYNLTTSGVTAGQYGRVTVDQYGRVTAGKRQETYTGTTDGSGNYTVTFSTPYSAAPNLQASISNQGSNSTQQIKNVSVSTTGFTVNTYQRSAVTLLGIEVLLAATAVVSGLTVDVLVTEK